MARESSNETERMQDHSTEHISLLSLPLEVIFPITEHLSVHDALSLAVTNHFFFDLINDRTYKLSIHTLPIEHQVLWWVAKQPSPSRHALSAAKRALSTGAQPHAIVPRDAIDRPYKDHDTPFLRAVRVKNRSLIHLFLEHGVDPTTAGSFCTPLTLAADQNDVETLSILLGSAPDAATREQWANSSTPGGTYLLQGAVASGFAGITSHLLSAGANPAGPDDGKGVNPLHLAIRGGFPDVVALLLDAGANMLDANYQSSDVTVCWGLAVHLASRSSGAECDMEYEGNRDRIDVLKVCLARRGVDAGMVFDLLSSSRYKTLFTMRILLGAGLDANAMSPNLGLSLLDDYAAVAGDVHPQGEKTTPEDWVSLLLEFGADVNSRDTQTAVTPLIRAIHGGRTEMVKLLLEKGADVSLRDNSGRGVLDHLDMSQGSTDKVTAMREFLMDYGRTFRELDETKAS